MGCDLLKNSYLCLLNNTGLVWQYQATYVVICWKIRIFAYWTTPDVRARNVSYSLWFAEKFVSLLIEQHLRQKWKTTTMCCDLLKNSYLCLLNNTSGKLLLSASAVVICWKIRIFAYWTTPGVVNDAAVRVLWFAEKFVSLLIEQHLAFHFVSALCCCDLLKNSYLCLLNNTFVCGQVGWRIVVICWKIRIFAYWTTPLIACDMRCK